MTLTKRACQEEDDYWLIREFLREVFLLNERRELSWQAYRFDYWRWHGVENLDHGRGLVKALLNEGLRRSSDRGAAMAYCRFI